MRKIDRLNIKLLNCLQQDNQMTADELAQQIGLSPSAVARRLRRLRSDGIILADAAVLAERAVGLPLSAVVRVQLERHALNELDALRRKLRESENIQMCLEVSGDFDIVLLVVATDMDAFNALMDPLLEANPAVRRFETSFVKRRVKATLALPLDHLSE